MLRSVQHIGNGKVSRSIRDTRYANAFQLFSQLNWLRLYAFGLYRKLSIICCVDLQKKYRQILNPSESPEKRTTIIHNETIKL